MASDRRAPDGERLAAPPLHPALAPAALLRLMTWLSPAYPVGAFSFSSGIEWAVEAGDIADADSLRGWLETLLLHGPGLNDGILLAAAYDAAAADDADALAGVAELAAALVPSRERHLETVMQGRAFVDVTRAAWPCAAMEWLAAAWSGPVCYPVAVGVACAGHDIPRAPAMHAFLGALVANWVSAGVRLVPLGQTDSQRVIKALAPAVETAARRALAASLDDLGGACFRADLSAVLHETQYTRLFRS